MKLRIATILLAFTIAAVNCKYSSDEVNSVLYDLSISGFPLNEEAKQLPPSPSDSSGIPTDTISVANKYGQKYECRVPNVIERLAATNEEGLLDPPAAHSVTNQEIKDVLDPVLKGLCFKNTRDRGNWWTYEFCYKGDIMQYHLENEKRSGETIYLGRFESEKDWSTPEAIGELSGKRKKTLYHSQYYTNGTVCDLTNNFRRTEVRFMCYEDLTSGTFLQSVDEPESCEYVLTVYSAALCRLPVFLPVDRKPPPLKIECHPVLTAVEYEKYSKAKEAEEAEKAAEALRKKQLADEQAEVDARAKKLLVDELKRVKEDTITPAKSTAGDPSLPSTSAAVEKPILDILGRQKPDFMKPILVREAAIAAGKTEEQADKEADEVEMDNRLVGAYGTIEYEFLTHWVEQELQDLEMGDGDSDDDEDDVAKDLTELEKYAVSEFKRRTRRVSIVVAFQNRLEEMAEDVFFSITQYDKRMKKLRGERMELAKQEIETALMAALNNILDELDAVERDMELLDEKTSGVLAFEQMREMIEGRQNLMKEFEDSKLSAAEFIKAKIAAMKPLSNEEMAIFDEEGRKEEAKILAKKTKGKSGVKEAAQKPTADDDSTARTSAKKRQPTVDEMKTGKDASAADRNNIPKDPSAVDNGKAEIESKSDQSQKSDFRQEVEYRLKTIMGDVDKELRAEGLYEEMDDQEVSEVQSEAFRTVARALTNLLENLDEAERTKSTDDDDGKQEEKAAAESQKSKSSRDKTTTDAMKRLEVWKKLINALDEEDQSTTKDNGQRKPLGKIQVQRGAPSSKSKHGTDGTTDGVRVRVSTIKQATSDGEEATEETSETMDTSKLERRLAEKLKEAGFDTQGRPVQVKIITNLDLSDNSNTAVHMLSDEESEQFTNVIYAILGGQSVEQTSEQRRQNTLESSYNFGGAENEDNQRGKNSDPMETVVLGGGRP